MEPLDIPKTDDELRERIAMFRAKATAIGAADLSRLPPSNPHDGTPGCYQCDGAGWFPGPDGRYSRCSCVYPVNAAEGVPCEFESVVLPNYEMRGGQRTAVQRAIEFFTGGKRDLYLYGGVGAGKTRLACALANTLHQSRQSVYFGRVPLLLHQLQPGRDNSELEQRLLTAGVVVLDDIGAERDQATDYTRRTLLMLYEGRHDKGLRTVWTSNKSLDELGAMQGDDRLTSRISGRADVVKIATGDQRLLRRVK